MKLRARGLLLFTFAFSSALTLTETSENGKPNARSSGRDLTEKPAPGSDLKHDLDKRSAEIFPGDEDRKQELEPANVILEADNPEKRARVGFTGMRGKKEFSADDYCSRALRARLEGALNKRFLTSFNEMFGGKRASLAFHGMRGKKSWDYEMQDAEVSPPRDLLVSSGLVDPEEGSGGSQEGLIKRSPYAFQGMRGKKENAIDFKRAMGFLGMRGKKASEVWDSDYKRAPQASFFGMKGKKAQSSGFFGMRGKKASPNAFFGIKGKREPFGYDFDDLSLNQINESGSSNNRFRRGITWLNNSKKAKNAFFGIRGKKTSESSTGDSKGVLQ